MIVLFVRDMVKHAGREDDILALGRKRDYIVDQNETLVTGKALSCDVNAARRNVAANQSGLAQMFPEIGKRIADAGTEIEDARGGRVARANQAGEIGDFVLGKYSGASPVIAMFALC